MGGNNNAVDFFFVQGFQADAQSKRRMRRHVMMGKNAGRTLQRRSRQQRQAALRMQCGRLPTGSNQHAEANADEQAAMMDTTCQLEQDATDRSVNNRVLRALAVPRFMSAEAHAVVDQCKPAAEELLNILSRAIALRILTLPQSSTRLLKGCTLCI
jgi:hypothetical protein